MMPDNNNATMRRLVATGRRINGREGFILTW